MYNLLEIFSTNRKLKYLNLSWNAIVALPLGNKKLPSDDNEEN